VDVLAPSVRQLFRNIELTDQPCGSTRHDGFLEWSALWGVQGVIFCSFRLAVELPTDSGEVREHGLGDLRLMKMSLGTYLRLLGC